MINHANNLDIRHPILAHIVRWSFLTIAVNARNNLSRTYFTVKAIAHRSTWEKAHEDRRMQRMKRISPCSKTSWLNVWLR